MEAVRSLLIKNSRLTLCTIVEQLNVSEDTVIHEDLNRRETYAHFVLHCLIPEQKEMRVNCCRDFVEITNSNPNFLNAVVTGSETNFFFKT